MALGNKGIQGLNRFAAVDKLFGQPNAAFKGRRLSGNVQAGPGIEDDGRPPRAFFPLRTLRVIAAFSAGVPPTISDFAPRCSPNCSGSMT